MAYWREKDGLKYLYGTVDGKKDSLIKPLGNITANEANTAVDDYHAKFGRGNRKVSGSKRLMVGVWEDYMKHLVDENYSPRTIQCAEDCVKPFIVTVPQVRDLADKLAEWDDKLKNWKYRRSPKGPEYKLTTESRAHRLRAISAFCAWAKDTGITEEDVFEVAKVKIPAQREDAGRALLGPQVKAIFENWPAGRNAQKDAYSKLAKVFFEIVFYGGVRLTECLGLDDEHPGLLHENVDRTRFMIRLPDTKGGSAREVALPEGVIDAIPTGHGPVFFNRISERTLRWYLKRACRAANISGRVRIHDGRVSGATEWARKNPNIKMLMDQFGWKTARMAAHYLKVATDERVAQAQKINYE